MTEKELKIVVFPFSFVLMVLDIMNESNFIGYIIECQSGKMDGRGRGRACLSHMHRDMKNLQRQVVDIIDNMVNQMIIQREVYDEETD